MRVTTILISLLFIVGCQAGSDESVVRSGHVSIAHLWLPHSEYSSVVREDIWIEGSVIATDKMGEVSSCFVVWDGSAGIEVKVDASDVDTLVPLYSRVRISCMGLSIGRQGKKMVLGQKPSSDSVVEHIPAEHIFSYVSILDNVDELPQPQQLSLANITIENMLSPVMVRDVRIIANGCREWCAKNSNGQKLTTIHYVTDERDTMRLVVARGVIYASESLPTHRCDICGIVDWYDGDIALRVINHGVISR